MNRRKAIGRIVLAGIGGGILYSGYKWYDWTKSPDISYLEQHKELIAALAETIIPATVAPDSPANATAAPPNPGTRTIPGAREAGVADFIVVMTRDCTDRMSANKFIEGLKTLDSYCQSGFGKPYAQCNTNDQESILRHFEEQGRPFGGLVGKAQNAYLGKSFFTTLKEYTVQGYCTSMAGATRALAYDPVPGQYRGCIPMKPGQPAWATSGRGTRYP
jgi:hypothetical protein